MKNRTMVMSLPTRDGTVLQAWLHRNDDGQITLDSQLQFVEDTGNGYRKLVAYKVSGIIHALDSRGKLTLHQQEPGLTIDRPWMVTLLDWVQLFAEWTVDTEKGEQ